MAAPTSLARPSEKTLANGEPSTHGTFRPFATARMMAVLKAKADVERTPVPPA